MHESASSRNRARALRRIGERLVSPPPLLIQLSAKTRNTHTVIKNDSLIIARGRYVYIKLVHLLAEATAFRQACLTTSRLAEHRRAATAHNHRLGVAENSCAAKEERDSKSERE